MIVLTGADGTGCVVGRGEVLGALGYNDDEVAALLDKGAVRGFNPEEFTWAPVRDKGPKPK